MPERVRGGGALVRKNWREKDHVGECIDPIVTKRSFANSLAFLRPRVRGSAHCSSPLPLRQTAAEFTEGEMGAAIHSRWCANARSTASLGGDASRTTPNERLLTSLFLPKKSGLSKG